MAIMTVHCAVIIGMLVLSIISTIGTAQQGMFISNQVDKQFTVQIQSASMDKFVNLFPISLSIVTMENGDWSITQRVSGVRI